MEAEKEIKRLIERFFQGTYLDLEATEVSIRHSMHKIGGIFLEKVVNADRGDYRGVKISCPRGHEALFREYRKKKVTTVLSEITIKRAYYYCESCGEGFIPKDRDLDIENTSFSPGIRRMIARVGAKESFDEGRQDLEELAGVRVTTKT